MKNILITGGAGFIGSNFVRFILDREPQARIINLDILTYAGSLENLRDLPCHSEERSNPNNERHIFVEGDICDRGLVDQLLDHHQIDTIVHFAAETHVDRSILGPEQFIRANIQGTFTLLEAARHYWLVKQASLTKPVAGDTSPAGFRFHHVSTDEVYGSLGPADPAFSETTLYAPNSPYAASKAASDHLVRAYGATYGLPFTLTNCSNNYGPRQFPEKLIPLTILNALEGRALPIYGDGKQIRDWLYVEDHCDAIWTVLQKAASGETYNIGGWNQPTNLEIVHTICDILDRLVPNSPYAPHRQLIQFVADRPGHDRRYAMDIRKIGRELHWQPQKTLATGLQQTVEWYLDHADWVESIRRQQDYQSWMAKNYNER